MGFNNDENACAKCGGYKKGGEFPTCRKCFLAEKTETGEICECGKLKRVEFPTCYDCFKAEAGSDQVCKCGRIKKSKFPTCLECFKKENGQS